MLTEEDSLKTAAPLERILIVDDEGAANTLQAELTACGFKVSTARDGGQTYGAIRMRPPDMVLIEAILPTETGFEICEKIKQQSSRVPVMMLTEINLESARNLAQRVGADGYLTKPCATELLCEVMREVAENVAAMHIERDSKEVGVIHFRCRCGKRLRERFENRGKYVNCPKCTDRMLIPNQTIKEFVTRAVETDEGSSADLEPMKFITIKCQHCSTFYRLAKAGTDWRTCPRCDKQQTGSLSIVGAPISQAALESSLRVLRVLNGKSKGKKILLPATEITFGRAADCAIRHNSKSVSEHHCRLKPTPRGVVVTDLGSEHGTFIEGERLSPNEERLLGPQALLWIGELQFRLLGEETTAEDEAARVQNWSARQDEAREKGVKLIDAGSDTASEAAQVIRQYWNLTRSQQGAAEAESPVRC